jgi:very-short-patch-repair endonuclease
VPEQDKELLGRAKRLRNEPTPFEEKLWAHLRGSRLGGYKFRRQHVIGFAITDFFCPQKALIVELDGDTHYPASDKKRDGEMSRQGFVTRRYSNTDVGGNIEGVLTDLLATLQAASDRWSGDGPTPTPPSRGRGSK